MKRVLLFTGLTLTMLMSFLSASGYDLEVDGICYNVISLEDCTVETTESRHPKLAKGGVLNIPNYITHNGRTLTVIRIGEDSFKSSDADIKKVNIGDKIQQISEGAFEGCLKLTSVYAPSIIEIGPWAFAFCGKLTDVDLGSGLEVIGEKAFYCCDELTSIYAPSTIEIGPSAFWGCDKLSEVVLGQDLESIDCSAFELCRSLMQIKIPDNLKKIGEFCFSCSGLKSFDLHKVGNIDEHNTLPILSKGLFQGCKNLTKVEGFNNLSELPDSIFCGCNNLDVKDILASEKLRVIGSGALAGCKFPEEIIVRPLIKKLGKGALGGFGGKLNILDSEEILEVDRPFDEMHIKSCRLGRDLSSWDFSFPPELEELIVGPLVTVVVPPIAKSPGDPHYVGTTYGGFPFLTCFNLKTVIIEPSSNVLEISGIGERLKDKKTNVEGETVVDVDYAGLFSKCPIRILKIFRPLKSNLRTSYSHSYFSDDCYKYLRVIMNAKMPFNTWSIENLSMNYDNFSYYKPDADNSLNRLYIGFYVSEVPALNVCPLTEISVRNGIPPKAMGFNTTTYMNGKLLVPTGTKDLYKEDDTWGKFWLIEEDERLFDKITAIRLPDEEKSLAVGEVVSLKPLIVPDFATIKKLSYSSSDPNVVSCNDAGELKAESIGSATITISACDGSDVSLEYKINVTE